MFVGMVTAGCRDSSVRVSLSGLGLLLHFFFLNIFFLSSIRFSKEKSDIAVNNNSHNNNSLAT
jgi:succinate dehydrogenase/fumarate reductase cytochrome b subunit